MIYFGGFMSLIIISIVLVLGTGYASYYLIKNDREGYFILPTIFFLISILLLVIAINLHIFELNKSTFYKKPKIVVIKQTDSSIRYLFDDKIVTDYYLQCWLNTNNIWEKFEYYKNKTNREYVCREELSND